VQLWVLLQVLLQVILQGLLQVLLLVLLQGLLQVPAAGAARAAVGVSGGAATAMARGVGVPEGESRGGVPVARPQEGSARVDYAIVLFMTPTEPGRSRLIVWEGSDGSSGYTHVAHPRGWLAHALKLFFLDGQWWQWHAAQ